MKKKPSGPSFINKYFPMLMNWCLLMDAYLTMRRKCQPMLGLIVAGRVWCGQVTNFSQPGSG